MTSWIGCGVSINCDEPLGCYQGTIIEADGSTITLTRAFRNGFPYPKPQVTLKYVISMDFIPVYNVLANHNIMHCCNVEMSNIPTTHLKNSNYFYIFL